MSSPELPHDPAPQQLRARAVLINLLSTGLDNGASGLSSVPGLLRQVLEEGSWQHFITMRDEEVRHDSFYTFVTTPPLKGLGASEDLIRRLVGGDTGLHELIDRHMARPTGRPASSTTSGETEKTVSNRHGSRPAGTTQAAGLRKLRKHAPHLLPQVTAGDLSVNRALIQAGLRERTVSVPVSRPEKTADVLRRNLTPDQLSTLIALLARPRSEEE
ncbi:hypothetical protein [Streptomyces antibioticus]|uniref:hypothetical protein n=1 Tax=Streptomyces antibioticus TaxID=1890 RepID=UPI0022530628|nr:hypothetical protein [Streptomyces antibioticus]MCX4740799.1 hypothetical protein [Streptomyces antibioticus]